VVVDNNKFVPEKFAPQFKTLYEKYYEILQLSKKNANEISAFATKFDGTVRKYGDPNYRSDSGASYPNTTRIKLIENSLKVTADFQTDTTNINKKLEELQAGLSEIHGLLDPTHFTKNEDSDLKKEKQDIFDKVKRIEAEIQDVDGKVRAL